MGYASDLELLCVYGGPGTTTGPHRIAVAEYAEMLVHQLLECIVARRSGIFAIDMRLRPFGTHGSLATSVEAFHEYYRVGGQAAPFERQALIKLRYVAGDAALGQAIEAARDTFVYSQEPFDLANALHLRQRQINELVAPGAVDSKYSPGGLVDIEYTAQYLQLMHGARIATLRTPSTLAALQALQEAGLLAAEACTVVQAAYQFLRALIDALRLVRGNASDLILPPVDSEEFLFLARRMGYWQAETATRQLAADIAQHMQQARRVYQEHFQA
jgi:glutamate-ammonia-ligase adenylyltransferase